MNKISDTEFAGTKAVRQLRMMRLKSGNYFMINLNSLPPDHCYLEYPGGSIKLAVCHFAANTFSIVRELDIHESSDLRKKFSLDVIK